MVLACIKFNFYIKEAYCVSTYFYDKNAICNVYRTKFTENLQNIYLRFGTFTKDNQVSCTDM